MPWQPEKKPRQTGHAPAWMVTFADLATLLLTFFILLLSFAELDAEKYKAMANSLALTFGSANLVSGEIGGFPLTLIEADTVSLPEPSESLELEPQFIDELDHTPGPVAVPEGVVELATRMIRELEPEVADNTLNISYDEHQVVIRFSEAATFRSGEAEIKPDMIPIIDRVAKVLSHCSGDVLVSGHTDDRPISSSRFRSNWDLSAARAVSVVHELVLNHQVPADRVIAAGRAETRPLAPNNTPENRALNRRVEIAIRNPECSESVPTRELPVEILP